MTVGILALQGDFREHEETLQHIGAKTLQVRLPSDLVKVDRLVIPGGESTTIGKLLVLYKLLKPIQERAIKGMPIWGTCAGAILMAKHITDGKPDQPALKLMSITARRNAFGRQLDSFETDVVIKGLGTDPIRIVFIRAPILEHPEKDVDILATLPGGQIVAAQQKNMLATCFHPELTEDVRFHEYFLTL